MKSAPPVSPLAPAGFPDLPKVRGVRFATAEAGVRYAGRTDVMLAVTDDTAVVAGVLTRSRTASAAVEDCRRKLGHPEAGKPVAILVNSGNANAFTGAKGAAAVARISDAVAVATGVPPANVFTASTGVIGEPLPDDRITAVLDRVTADLSPDGIESAARAIMTTDTFPKAAGRSVTIRGTPVAIAGIAKGSGMIAPDMATMLAYVFTDAWVSYDTLQAWTAEAAARTFNRITVDSDTSTSDTLLVVATGAAEADVEAAPEEEVAAFITALAEVMRDLAHQIVRDGEGASKFVTVTVTGAESDDDADRVAFAIANSPLVKTAIAGEDANWGRVVMAVGKSGAAADRDRLSIRFGDVTVAEAGERAKGYDEAAATAHMKGQEVTIAVDLGLGDGAGTVWTCDLTHGYVDINADYRS